MACPKGWHQHPGVKEERMLACHPISEKHKNPVAQRNHEMALQDEQAYAVDPSKQPKKRTPAEEREYKKNVLKIKGFLKQLTRGKKSFMFFPISFMLTAMDIKHFVSDFSAKMKQSGIERESEKSTQTYKDTMDALSKLLPQDAETFDEKTVVEVKTKFAEGYRDAFTNLGKRKKALMDEYGDPEKVRKIIIGTEEYAVWKAYEDFLTSCENNAQKVNDRISRTSGANPENDKAVEELMAMRRSARSRTAQSAPPKTEEGQGTSDPMFG